MIEYKVKLANRKKPEYVNADYFKIDGGVVTFRNLSMDRGGYPVFVRCYAAGTWISIDAVNRSDGT